MTIDSFCLIFIGSTPPVIRGGETQDGQFQSQGMYATKNICILFFCENRNIYSNRQQSSIQKEYKYPTKKSYL